MLVGLAKLMAHKRADAPLVHPPLRPARVQRHASDYIRSKQSGRSRTANRCPDRSASLRDTLSQTRAPSTVMRSKAMQLPKPTTTFSKVDESQQ